VDNPTLPEIGEALAWLATLCTSGGALKPDDYKAVVQACDLATPFLRSLRAAIDSGAYPQDALQVRCGVDPLPHAMRFHAKHEAQAP
jgi:hypothetical protein